MKALPGKRTIEIIFWLVPVVAFFLLPGYLVLGSQILIVAIFALSLDLILGYAGIVSLGHAAFFGLGAYTAGILAVKGWGEPLSGLLAGGAMAALAGFIVSFLVVRGEDLARLMVTLGIGLLLFEAANRAAFITGGVDGLSGVAMWKLLGVFPFDIGGKTASPASARTSSACLRSARRCSAGWSRPTRSARWWPESPARSSRRPRSSSASTRSASTAPRSS